MTLEQIFETNPGLLKEPEVQNLIAYAKANHSNIYKSFKRLQEFEMFVADKCMYSEAVLIDGKDCKETINEILTKYGTY